MCVWCVCVQASVHAYVSVCWDSYLVAHFECWLSDWLSCVLTGLPIESLCVCWENYRMDHCVSVDRTIWLITVCVDRTTYWIIVCVCWENYWMDHCVSVDRTIWWITVYVDRTTWWIIVYVLTGLPDWSLCVCSQDYLMDHCVCVCWQDYLMDHCVCVLTGLPDGSLCMLTGLPDGSLCVCFDRTAWWVIACVLIEQHDGSLCLLTGLPNGSLWNGSDCWHGSARFPCFTGRHQKSELLEMHQNVWNYTPDKIWFVKGFSVIVIKE